MPKLPQKKVGLIACSGEDFPEGTISRVATLKVLEQLRPEDTVTLCLPLFLAGEERERAFARFYPTIAIDGCDERCAARATGKYSAPPAASLVIMDLVAKNGLPQPHGLRRLDAAGEQVAQAVAEVVAGEVDRLLGKEGPAVVATAKADIPLAPAEPEAMTVAACACGSGIPVAKISVNGRQVELIALPAIFEQFREQGRPPADGTTNELMNMVRIYNAIPADDEPAIRQAVLREYDAYCAQNDP
jgi:uncharacterized metal-binding protein